MLLLLSVPTFGTAALVVTAALIGFTLGGYAGLIQAAVVEAVEPRHAGAAMGYSMLLLSFGTMVGPAAFGIGVEWTGYANTWTAMAVLLVAGRGLFSRQRASGPRDESFRRYGRDAAQPSSFSACCM